MKLKIIAIGMALVLGFWGNIPWAAASEEVKGAEVYTGVDLDRGKNKSPFGSFGLDDSWGAGADDREDMRELAEKLRKASPEDFKAAMDLLLNEDVPFEDAVAAVLFALAEGMDEAVEAQAQRVEDLKNGSGPKTGGEAPSIDREMAKLKQETDRRGQFFDTVRQVSEKYEETAKGPIQKLRD